MGCDVLLPATDIYQIPGSHKGVRSLILTLGIVGGQTSLLQFDKFFGF